MSLAATSGSGSTASSPESQNPFFFLGAGSVLITVGAGRESSFAAGTAAGVDSPHIDAALRSFFFPKPSKGSADALVDSETFVISRETGGEPDTNSSRAGLDSGALPTPKRRATESQEDLIREGASDLGSDGVSNSVGATMIASACVTSTFDGAAGSTDDFVGSFGFADGLR